jgi:hypothetical protein
MKIKFTLMLLFFASLVFGQAPKLINYQGIVRGTDGAPTINQPISIRFQILKGSPTGTVVYTELQSLTTNSLGLIQTQIGLSANLGNVVWNAAQLYLEVAMDITGGSNLSILGTQQIMGVPYSFLANNVPAAYSPTTNILSVGDNTFQLSSPPPTSLTATGIASVTAVGNNSFQVDVPAPSFTNSGAVQIIGTYPNYTVAADSPTITGIGNASVTTLATNSFVVDVPFLQITATSSAGLSGVSGSGTNSVNINIPGTTLTGLGAVTIGTSTVANTYSITVPQTSITLTQTGTTAGLTSSSINDFTLNIPTPSISAAGLATVSTNGASFSVGVAPFTYVNTTGILSSGPNTLVVAPLLTFNNGTITSGPSSNSISLSSLTPWIQSVNTVTLSNSTDRVGIGASAPTENLQVESAGNSSVSILSGTSNTSDLGFGTTANHGLGRLRYDNTTGSLAFWTAGAIRASLTNTGQLVIGTTPSYSSTTGLTVGRAGAFNNQLMITGGDNSNIYGGQLSLGENLNPSSGFSLKLDAAGNRLLITNDLSGNSPIAAFGGYGGSSNGMVIGSSYAPGTQAPAEGLAVQGFVGIGLSSPAAALHVNGNSIITGSTLIGGNTSIAGSASVTGNATITGNHTNLGQTFANGNVFVGSSATAPADIRVFGGVKLGTGLGTTQAPYYPGGNGMVYRRVNSTVFNSVATLARTADISFETEATTGGIQITRTTGNINQICHCSGVNTAGVTVNKIFNNLIIGTTQVYSPTDNILYFRCIFGDVFSNGHTTEITVSRFPGDYFWIGHLISTFNQ